MPLDGAGSPATIKQPLGLFLPWGLTEGVVLLLDGECEASVGTVNAEEDHGDVLTGTAGNPWCVGGAVVCVALLQGQWVVLGAGEHVSLQDPAIKYLPRGGITVSGYAWISSRSDE